MEKKYSVLGTERGQLTFQCFLLTLFARCIGTLSLAIRYTLDRPQQRAETSLLHRAALGTTRAGQVASAGEHFCHPRGLRMG